MSLSDVTKSFLWLARSAFLSHPDEDYRWYPDESLTKVVITDQSKTDAKILGARPLIMTQRAALSGQQLGIHPVVRNTTGDRTSLRLYAGSMIIHCCSRSGPEAEELALYLADMIPLFSREIVRRTLLHAIDDRITISPEGPVSPYVLSGGEQEWLAVVLQVPMQFQSARQINYDAMKKTLLQQLNLNLRVLHHDGTSEVRSMEAHRT